jgi:hypothetical protein
MGLAIVPGVVLLGRISGQDRLCAGPLELVPDQAGGSKHGTRRTGPGAQRHRRLAAERLKACISNE